jgi:hypothetical protein
MVKRNIDQRKPLMEKQIVRKLRKKYEDEEKIAHLTVEVLIKYAEVRALATKMTLLEQGDRCQQIYDTYLWTE